MYGTSPAWHMDIKLERATIARSDAEPPYESDTNDTRPPGVAPTKTFSATIIITRERYLLC